MLMTLVMPTCVVYGPCLTCPEHLLDYSKHLAAEHTAALQLVLISHG